MNKMSREYALRLAQEVGFHWCYYRELNRVVELVRAEERERLANILEDQCKKMSDLHEMEWLKELASEIRSHEAKKQNYALEEAWNQAIK